MRRNKHIIPEQNGEDKNVADHAQDGENRQRDPVDAEFGLGGIGEMRGLSDSESIGVHVEELHS